MPEYREITRRGTTTKIPTTPQRIGSVYEDSGLSDILTVIDTWQLGAEDLINNLLAISESFSEEVIQREILERSFNEAARRVQNQLFEIIWTHVKEACIRSVEYNYQPYLERLEAAILAHLPDIVSFVPNRDGEDQVSIGFSALGDIQEWADAVRQVRADLKVGLSSNMGLRDQIWKEKIYGVAREGVQISRSYKRTKSTKDITSRYSELYDLTIRLRLLEVPSDHAPFWSLLLYGNTKYSGATDDGGTPYPAFQGYDFVTGISDSIIRLFREFYEGLVDAFEREYRSRASRDFGYRDFTKAEIMEILMNYIEDKLEEIDREEVYKEKGQKTIVKEQFEEYELQAYITKTGRVGHRTYQMDNNGKKKQIKNSLVIR